MIRPLEQFEILNTDQLDEARDQIAQRFCAHRLELRGSAARLHVRHRVAPGRLLSLNFIHYGATVLIEPGALARFYLIQIPLTGAASIENGGAAFQSCPDAAAVLNPDRHTRMIWQAKCEQILIYVPVDALIDFAEEFFGRTMTAAIVFDTRMDFANPALSQLRRKVLGLVAAADKGHLFGKAGAINQTLVEQQVLADLLVHQASNVQPFAHASTPGASSGQCHRAAAFIRDHAHGDIKLADIAKAAGVPGRTLQHQFKARFGRSPIEMLQEERLMRAHCDLGAGRCDATVTGIAARWGFYHFGRFSRYYRQAFGELPSQTLARAIALQGGKPAN